MQILSFKASLEGTCDYSSHDVKVKTRLFELGVLEFCGHSCRSDGATEASREGMCRDISLLQRALNPSVRWIMLFLYSRV